MCTFMYYLILFTVFDSIRLSWPNSFSRGPTFSSKRRSQEDSEARFTRKTLIEASPTLDKPRFLHFQFFFVVFVLIFSNGHGWLATPSISMWTRHESLYRCASSIEYSFCRMKNCPRNYTASKHDCVCEGTLVCVPQALLVSDICDREGNSF